MSEKLRNCPFCGENPSIKNVTLPFDVGKGRKITQCKCGAFLYAGRWNTRPIEDELQHRIDELTAENAILTAELAELNNKAVFIQFENEDELSADISSDIYSAMFNCSHVDVVRLFPYIKENGQKYYLVMLREDE